MCGKNSETQADQTKTIRITEPQRKCLLHVFRNCEQAITGIMDLLDDPYTNIAVEDLVRLLPNVCKELTMVLNAAEKGSFCSIPKSECQYVAPFVGCEGNPDLGLSKNNKIRAKYSTLNILNWS